MSKSTKEFEFEPDYAVHPGETLAELSKMLGCRELAVRGGISYETLERICAGVDPITPEIARALGTTGMAPEQFWLNLQDQYDRTVARLAAAQGDECYIAPKER